MKRVRKYQTVTFVRIDKNLDVTKNTEEVEFSAGIDVNYAQRRMKLHTEAFIV